MFVVLTAFTGLSLCLDGRRKVRVSRRLFEPRAVAHCESANHLHANATKEGTMTLISAMQVTLDGYSSPGDADWVDSWADGLDLLPPVDAFILGGGMFPDYE